MFTTSIWAAPPQAGGPLLPIGGGYADTYAGFAQAVIGCAAATLRTRAHFNIVVLPTAYSSSAALITDAERNRNLRDAEARRRQIEDACRRAAPPGVTCSATLAPIFTRTDANDPAKCAPLTSPLSAVFMLGGDQTVAMAALADTPAEAALATAHRCGAVIGGTSAGGGMLSVEMLGGYRPNFAAGNSLELGAADVWNSMGRRGLAFGVPGALLDQHFFQRGRFGRLLNAIASPGAPTLGIGVDAYTGARIDASLGSGRECGRTISGVFGLYGVAVLDAGTYHAADTVQYTPLEDSRRPPVLSLRNVLVHLLAPGDFSYNLETRRSSLGAPGGHLVRAFDGLRRPRGAGALVLAGNLSTASAKDSVVARFRKLAGGSAGKVLIYADGYQWDRSARRAGEQFAALLGTPADVRTAADLAGMPPTLAGYTGIALIGRDQSRVAVASLASWLPPAWRGGLPVLAENALAAVLGVHYSAHGPTPIGREEAEFATQRSFLAGETVVRRGLSLVAAIFEPELLADNRWGRYFSLAYTHPELVAFGLNRGAALEISDDGAWALGENVTFGLDLRAARLAEGTNGGFVIANGILDVFTPGDEVRPQVASMDNLPPAPALLSQPQWQVDKPWEPDQGAQAPVQAYSQSQRNLVSREG